MSRLYVRLKTGFYSHRKTARLRQTIGDDAFWIPPRLWAYAAENQPDGDMSSYSTEELAELLGCSKYAPSIKQALSDAGFLDPDGFIHDWEEHAGYHKRFSDRAKTAATARWGKKKEPKKKDSGHRTVDSGDKHCLTHACGMLEASRVYDAYPRKVGKPAAIKAIQKAVVKFGFDLVFERTVAYSACRNGEDSQFTPHPSTWFNQERFNDDPSTWKNNGTHQPNNRKSTDRNAGTLNAGRASQYANVGKLLPLPNPERPAT